MQASTHYTLTGVHEVKEGEEEDEEAESKNKFVWDLTRSPEPLDRHEEARTTLTELATELPAIDTEVRSALMPAFCPSELCPTVWLKDIAAHCHPRSPKYLGHKHAHPRDQRIVFVEEPHLYFIDGSCENVISVSTLVKCFFHGFDAKRQSLSTFNSKTFQETHHRPSHDLHGCKTAEDIERRWAWWRDLGTLLHANIESYFNQEKSIDVHEENQKPFSQFLQLFEEESTAWIAPDWTPYRTEWAIFDEETRVAGQIDCCAMVNPETRRVVLLDWKRVKSIPDRDIGAFQGRPVQFGKGVCSDLEACKFREYALQLNLYKYILEKNYGFRVVKMLLVQLHPTLKRGVLHLMPNMVKHVERMMACRKLCLANK